MPKSYEILLKRIALEVAVIVVGILLAFAIDAWWEERQERIEEVEILHGLKSEFSRYRDELAYGIEYHAKRQNADTHDSSEMGVYSFYPLLLSSIVV